MLIGNGGHTIHFKNHTKWKLIQKVLLEKL